MIDPMSPEYGEERKKLARQFSVDRDAAGLMGYRIYDSLKPIAALSAGAEVVAKTDAFFPSVLTAGKKYRLQRNPVLIPTRHDENMIVNVLFPIIDDAGHAVDECYLKFEKSW
jgi:hypothetical protein